MKRPAQRIVSAKAGKINVGKGDGVVAQNQPSGQQRIAARTVSGDMIAGDGDQPQRLAALPKQARYERSPGELADDVVAHAGWSLISRPAILAE